MVLSAMAQYDEAKLKAEEVISKYALTIPVAVFEFAETLGLEPKPVGAVDLLKIIPKSDPHIKVSQQDDILGYFDKPNNVCYLNESNQSINRMRFTMAHELGHFFLHVSNHKGQFRRVTVKEDLLVPKDPQEVEANYFAGYLLMPDQKLMDILHLSKLMFGGETLIKEFADVFAVSTEAMRIRFKIFKQEHPDIWIKFNLDQKLF